MTDNVALSILVLFVWGNVQIIEQKGENHLEEGSAPHLDTALGDNVVKGARGPAFRACRLAGTCIPPGPVSRQFMERA